MTERLHFHALEKEMATHSSVLAWRIPGTGETSGLVGCRLWGRTESDTTEATEQQQQHRVLAAACRSLIVAGAMQLPEQRSNAGPPYLEHSFNH